MDVTQNSTLMLTTTTHNMADWQLSASVMKPVMSAGESPTLSLQGSTMTAVIADLPSQSFWLSSI